jgi:alkaline phosphatase D
MTLQNGPEWPPNLDAWDGYIASKNRTLETLHDNNSGNNTVIAGDTHIN